MVKIIFDENQLKTADISIINRVFCPSWSLKCRYHEIYTFFFIYFFVFEYQN